MLPLLKSKRQRSCIPRYVYVQSLQLTYTAFQLSCNNSGKPFNNRNSWIQNLVMMYNLSTSKDKEATSERPEFSGLMSGSAFSTADPHPELGENLPFSGCRLCLRAESTHPKHPKEWSPWKQNVDTHKWKASHFFVQATRNTRSWRNLLTADCRHKYILVSPCYKTSIKAFMAATTQSCSDIERTPSSDRTPRRKFWTLNKISKRSGQNGPELSGLWTHHKTSLRPQHMPMARQAWKWMCLMCSITPTSTHVSSGFEERYYPPTPRNVPWQEYMTKHALFCITYLFGNGCLKHSCQHWHVTDQIDW